MSDAPVVYFDDFIAADMQEAGFLMLRDGLAWERRETAPRSEYWTNTFDRPYTYGVGAGERTYLPRPSHPFIDICRDQIEAEAGVRLEGCFLNLYHDGSDSLGWHADDDALIDHNRPIAVITLGAGRDIAFKRNQKGAHPERMLLEPGSLLIMRPGMQQSHLHAIPKMEDEPVGARISLTFRGLVPA
ncbi:alpha-ketoglutarate-dependent dioxygenase [Brevundimonas phage vB_BpoS-Bambus]|nr:alpha-ketoglutarate-dependent dioxygenase [Brevundimonas phage vB_BpoS-Bambus]